MNSQPSQRYAPWLWLLLGLFVLRVVSQPLALLVDTPLRPRFESWHGPVSASSIEAWRIDSAANHGIVIVC
jgi:hypothetical protein